DGTTTVSSFAPVLNGRETRVFTLSQIFGAGTTTAAIAGIEVESLNTKLTGSLSGANPGGKTLTAARSQLTKLTFPLNLSSTREALVSIANFGDIDASVNLTLRSSDGQSIGTASRLVAAHTTLRSSLLNLFSVTEASVTADCYIIGTSSQPVRASVLGNPQQLVEEVPAFERSGLDI